MLFAIEYQIVISFFIHLQKLTQYKFVFVDPMFFLYSYSQTLYNSYSIVPFHAALIHAGVGVTQINSVFAALNIPPVHHKMLDKRQAEIGLVVEAVAEESVKQSIEEECKLTEG